MSLTVLDEVARDYECLTPEDVISLASQALVDIEPDKSEVNRTVVLPLVSTIANVVTSADHEMWARDLEFIKFLVGILSLDTDTTTVADIKLLAAREGARLSLNRLAESL